MFLYVALREEVANPSITPSDANEEYGRDTGVHSRKECMGDEDAFSLNEIGLYGLEGVCAYA